MPRRGVTFEKGDGAPVRTAQDYLRASAPSMTYASTVEDVRARLQARGAIPWVDRVCRRHGVLFAELADTRANQRGNPRLSSARHEVWAGLHDTLGLSLSQIARDFNRDHTSILYAVRRHAARVAEELADLQKAG
jgi:hypothetical protein